MGPDSRPIHELLMVAIDLSEVVYSYANDDLPLTIATCRHPARSTLVSNRTASSSQVSVLRIWLWYAARILLAPPLPANRSSTPAWCRKPRICRKRPPSGGIKFGRQRQRFRQGVFSAKIDEGSEFGRLVNLRYGNQISDTLLSLCVRSGPGLALSCPSAERLASAARHHLRSESNCKAARTSSYRVLE